MKTNHQPAGMLADNSLIDEGKEQGGEPIYYHRPHELWNVAGGHKENSISS